MLVIICLFYLKKNASARARAHTHTHTHTHTGARLPPRHPGTSKGVSGGAPAEGSKEAAQAAGQEAAGDGGAASPLPNIKRQVQAFARRFWLRARDVLEYLLTRLRKDGIRCRVALV